MLQHPAGGGVSPDEKKKVAWCDCDNSPPPFFPRLLLCGEIMETVIRKIVERSDPQNEPLGFLRCDARATLLGTKAKKD